jgi:hypothetical protein
MLFASSAVFSKQLLPEIQIEAAHRKNPTDQARSLTNPS